MSSVEKKLNTTPTRQLLARASEFDLRMRMLEHNQAVMAWLFAEFLHNWRMSIAAAYAAQKDRVNGQTDGQTGERVDGQTGQ
jgi:hypothetical protein